jgi:hypothetical protein
MEMENFGKFAVGGSVEICGTKKQVSPKAKPVYENI